MVNDVKFASHIYPHPKFLNEYRETIENIKDTNLRKFIKYICLTGLRASECLNSYLFVDQEGNLLWRALDLKTRSIRLSEYFHRPNQYGFLGKDTLQKLLRKKVWKSDLTHNILNLDYEDLENYVNMDLFDVKYFSVDYFKFKTYMSAYMKLKREKIKLSSKFILSSRERGSTDYYTPAFHFFRKLYACELYSKTKDFIKTIENLKWKNPSMVMHYIKQYDVK